MNEQCQDIITMYNTYDKQVSGKINNITAYQLIHNIEKTFLTDILQLSDGTKIWNLIRIFIYTQFQTANRSRSNLFSFIKPQYILHHPIITGKTLYRILCNKPAQYNTKTSDMLDHIISHIIMDTDKDYDKTRQQLLRFINIFTHLKQYYYMILKKEQPSSVLVHCGYGRFPMALSQACHELNIPILEISHSWISEYLPAYRRETPTQNKDCIPDCLLAKGKVQADIVRAGNLFDKHRVFSHTILFTSQWILAEPIKEFITSVAELLDDDILILFKPHPYDKTNYNLLRMYNNIVVVDNKQKISDLWDFVTIHSTVFSGSALEAIQKGIPNIMVDINNLTNIKNTLFVVTTPNQFVVSAKKILNSYDKHVADTKQLANILFRGENIV